MTIKVKFKPEVQAMIDSAPEFDEDPNPGGEPIAHGFAEFKEYINKKTQEKTEDQKVTRRYRKSSTTTIGAPHS